MTIKEGYRTITVYIKQPGDEAPESGQERVIRAEIKKTGQSTPYVFALEQDLACCDELDYYLIMKHNSGKIEEQLGLEVIGGCAPFTWEVAGGTLVFYNSTTSGRSNTIRILSGTTDPEGDLITVTDSCGQIVNCLVRMCPGTTCISDEPPPGGEGNCETPWYVSPSIEMSGVFGSYLFKAVVTKLLEDNDVVTETILNVPHIPSGGQITSGIVTGAWEDFETELGLSSYNLAYTSDHSYFKFSDAHSLSVGDSIVVRLSGVLCSCLRQRIYTIIGGESPFLVEFSDGYSSEISYRTFAYSAFMGICNTTSSITVTDVCGNSVSRSWVPDLAALGWNSGSLTADNAGLTDCGTPLNITATTHREYCSRDYVVDSDGATGWLDVTYATDMISCDDLIDGTVSRGVTYPASIIWSPLGGVCCPLVTETLELHACPPGSINDISLDTEVVSTIYAAGTMDWKSGSAPTAVSRPVGGVNLYDYYVEDAVGSQTWEVLDSEYGDYAQDSPAQGYVVWEHAVTSGGINVLHIAPGACGTFRLVCTDDCNPIYLDVAVSNDGAWIQLFVNDMDARTAILDKIGLGVAILTHSHYVMGSGNDYIITLDQFKGLEGNLSVDRVSPPYGYDPKYCDPPYNTWTSQVNVGGWNDYVYRIAGIPGFIFSAAHPSAEWRPGGYWRHTFWDGAGYAGQRVCNQSGGSYVITVDYVSELRFYIWGC